MDLFLGVLSEKKNHLFFFRRIKRKKKSHRSSLIPETHPQSIANGEKEPQALLIHKNGNQGKMKTFVISGLHPMMTSDIIINYIVEILMKNVVTARVMSPSEKASTDLKFSSYSISCRDDVFERISAPSFWPSGVYINSDLDRS